ncbi:hypothetical protein VO178_19465 [Lysinibacillus fusiformis]|uniref:hypothetical protein n=1 Tax=Lysinibacillus fusiformis TaxID=28031 RepID=UPI002D77B2AC|nr:hypothetical protein [Lysinibacillus fusiformis]WRS97534.1 hypothetical protein VO178_19465 [Lysinibacillus fusiformis]
MQNLGNRIICDQDGGIIFSTGEVVGISEADVVPRKNITSLHCIDLEYGYMDYTQNRIAKIDLNTMQPIIEKIPVLESEEQKRIRELEDAFLLQADNEIGGIL